MGYYDVIEWSKVFKIQHCVKVLLIVSSPYSDLICTATVVCGFHVKISPYDDVTIYHEVNKTVTR